MKHEYTFRIIRGGGSEEDLKLIAAMVQDGWEAFVCNNFTFERHWFFKRPITGLGRGGA